MAHHVRRDTVWKLSLDLWSAQVMVWVASVGRDAVLTREAHVYFFDRYHRLAEQHRVRGHVRKAARLQGKAEEHWHPPEEMALRTQPRWRCPGRGRS